MKLFLTSNPFIEYEEDGEVYAEINPVNFFYDNLEECWQENMKFLMIASDPEDFENNDKRAIWQTDALEAAGLEVAKVAVLDSRNEDQAEGLIWGADLIIFSGGHVPTENAFFERMDLRNKILEFDGIAIGISAGSMNCADYVYAQPEEMGESEDPGFERWKRGLGLTGFNVLPHYQAVKDRILDGKRLYEDITFEDSEDNEFIALVDGSYLMEEEDKAILFGEAYLICNGETEQISEEGDVIELYYD